MEIKDRIILACLELARVKGFYNMSMDELAQQAGISKRTLYRYFRSKDEVIEASLDVFTADMAQKVAKITELDLPVPDMIEAMIKNLITHGQLVINPIVLNDLRVHYPQLWKKIDSFRLQRARLAITRFMKQSSNPILQEIDPRIVTAVILSSIQAVLNPDFILENDLSFASTATQLSKFLRLIFSN